ncbi:hypothetical protein BaRGS_00016748 [Batillaria attramentaria]|uniref:Midasin n=1 Tax=Batillaria attramentaria TaxID=370345 RepID=A0ABD0KZ59_9CAEN
MATSEDNVFSGKTAWNIFQALDLLCRSNTTCSEKLRTYLAKQIWSELDRQTMLKTLTEQFIHPSCVRDICAYFKPMILDIVERTKNSVLLQGHSNTRVKRKFAVSLGLSLPFCPELERFATAFVKVHHPFENLEDEEPKKKKAKRERISDVDWCRAMYNFAAYLSNVEEVISLRFVDPHLSHQDPFVRGCFQEEQQKKELLAQGQGAVSMETAGSAVTHTRHQLLQSDLTPAVVSVTGVLLPRLASEGQTQTQSQPHWVGVPSMMDSLHSLSLAVSAGRPVLIQGPVGCGKTSLVQHLAALTGRHSAPHLIKVQLGDQTDSKALLGTYQCTEVPGQFVWHAGVLTEAVTQGHWVLLEDLDHAPMEVVSTLAPLLQTSTLSLPGHGDIVRAAPGFQLFATQRLLDIYFMLSAGHHHLTSDLDTEGIGQSSEQETVGKFLSLSGRLISTRDLMSWCSRISADFDPSSPSSGAKVFQAALDCFVSCLSKPSKRLPLAEAIAAKLNITKDKAEYFLTKHKPSVDISPTSFMVGRAILQCKPQNTISLSRMPSATFSFTRPSVCLLEKVAVCVSRNESVLLVGETGTGKTSSVQYLAQQLGHKLHVINLNQQSDSIDLLGGFKPVDLKFVMMPFREEFEMLFCQTFSRKQNARFLGHLQNCFSQKRWHDLLSLMEHCQKSAVTKFPADTEAGQSWRKIGVRLQQLKLQIQETENVLAFSFIEGTLVKALRSGDWVLLDEINLAAAETLDCLAGLLESTDGSLVLTERGDMEPVVRHPDFRLFACMNPATDVGKKDLTPGIRNRFTEFYVDELERPADLKVLVGDYLRGLSLTTGQLDGIVTFYLEVRNLAATQLVDGTGHKPHYSLRTLCRALRFSRSHNCGSIARSLYEGFCLSFLTQLDRASHPAVEKLICKHVLGKTSVKTTLKQPLPEPSGGGYLNFEGYWISCGTLEPTVPDNYILTASVRANLKDLARVVSAGSHPVLLQGETSVGKTSLITWLARCSGNHCVRVNNHEHTDLQEYVGCYAADEAGKLVFKEGVLVEAMRKGYWIILDELNLAPTDVLEALNRLLDDNQELFIPETQEMVRAHPKFMLFATQNPPGHYGGRKMLSRAFRNRFVELHFDEIPRPELETILHQRCHIPLSYAKRLVAVMADLQVQRQGSGVFAGKHCMMTLRDLFRWAERYNCPDAGSNSSKFYNWDQHLADHGYMLLAGRVRKPEEAAVIQRVIEKHMKCKVGPERLFDLTPATSPTVLSILRAVTGQMDSSCAAVRFKEPVLLVGDTGCGKTTICQLFAAMKKKNLHSVNCHLHTESADFLGGLRPVRSHQIDEDVKQQKLFEWVDGPLVTAMKTGSMFLIDEISLADDSVLERLNSVLEPERCILLAEKGGGDGLESEVEIVQAAEGFQVFSTMNPGGDFGKKELSPALRNRFTEIWCPQSNNRDDLVSIIEHNIHPGIRLSHSKEGQSGFGEAIMDFVAWFSNNEIGKRCTVSIRDILSWVYFINSCSQLDGEGHASDKLEPSVAYIHGACLVFLDSLGAGVTSRGSEFDAQLARLTCLTFLQQQVKAITGCDLPLEKVGLQIGSAGEGQSSFTVKLLPDSLTIFPFSIPRETDNKETSEQYAIQAPTTSLNAQRILRGLQLPRPLLLEGAPGVGKTSLVAAVARLAGRELVRINLSEQTDVTDLFGADLPVEGATGGSFAWRDGPFLQALKAGHWVVFDELNLASQSVLEGLNACLDHRGEVFIPELGHTFHIQHGCTRIFACQNPLNQGGGRKGLPRSFLNRFTQVYVEPLARHDLIFICGTVYPSIPLDVLTKMVDFNMKMYEETMVGSTWGRKGAPWEFNLRDINRWCDLLLANQTSDCLDPGAYVGLVYQDRMRTAEDKHRVTEVFAQVFGTDSSFYHPSQIVRVTPSCVQAGHSFLERGSGQGDLVAGHHGDGDSGVLLLHHSLGPLESLMTCVNMGWMSILVGPASSGKSSLVQLMAELSGHSLLVLPMSSGMDTTELLGGFEQVRLH